MLFDKRKPVMFFALIFCLITAFPLFSIENPGFIIKFGHASGENSAVIRKKYSLLLKMISESLGCEIDFIHKKTYEDVQKAFIDREIDMGILNAFSFINIMDTPGLLPIAARVKENSKNYKSFFIVRKDSPIMKLEDIKGKVFAFQDIYSTSAYLVPRYHLKQNNINPDTDFGRVVYIPKQDSVIYAVLNRTIDAAAVASFIFNEQSNDIKTQFKIVEESLPFPLGPFVVNTEIGKDIIEKTKSFLLNLINTEEGRSALSVAELDSFTAIDITDYNYLIQIVKSMDSSIE